MSELIVAGTSTPVFFYLSFPFTLWSAHPALHTRAGWSWAPSHTGTSRLTADISPRPSVQHFCFQWDDDGLFPNPEDTTGIKRMKILIKKIYHLQIPMVSPPQSRRASYCASAAARREHRRVLVSHLWDVGSTSPSLWVAILGKANADHLRNWNPLPTLS